MRRHVSPTLPWICRKTKFPHIFTFKMLKLKEFLTDLAEPILTKIIEKDI